jgi:hypothetical protein
MPCGPLQATVGGHSPERLLKRPLRGHGRPDKRLIADLRTPRTRKDSPTTPTPPHNTPHLTRLWMALRGQRAYRTPTKDDGVDDLGSG